MKEIESFSGSPVVSQQSIAQTQAVERLGEWASAAQAAYEVAAKLVQTSFVPAQFKNNAIEATAAILAGSEVGLSPMASLNAFTIIQGKAAPSALALRAIVQSQGHEIVVVESTSARAIVKGRRRGSSEWSEVRWTIDRATALNLMAKDNWKKQPTAMLLARATSEVARIIGADAILGIGYTVEELTDGVVGENAEPKTKPTKKMKRDTPDITVADFEDNSLVTFKETENGTILVAAEEPISEPVTDKQISLINVLATQLGLTREQKLDGAKHYCGREISSTKELTKSEAKTIIDALQKKVQESNPEDQ